MITLGSWYSGAIDGFAYAAKQLGIETLYHIESNRDLWKYLRQTYGDKPIFRYDGHCGKSNLPWSHIIAGGDPCQPSSNAGLRRGKADHRYRWPEMFRGIREIRPDWVINENVAGSISNMVLDQKIADLESIGYSCQAFNIPAVAVNAYHERKRVWLVANADVQGWGELLCFDPKSIFKAGEEAYSLGASGNAFLRFEERFGEPAILPVSNGIPDHIIRLGAAGNSIVHQIPLIFLTAIQWIYENELQS